MAKLANTTVFTTAGHKKETPLDKTTRIVREIQDGEVEQRKIKTVRLRKARLEREAGTPVEALAATSDRARNRR